jgi:hypothetical protein
MGNFVLGETYTRDAIYDQLGVSRIAYLPTTNGRVVCGCFHRSEELNPNAPEEILFGREHDTPIIDETAWQVFQQGQAGEAIPVFLRRTANAWEYVGEYLCIGYTRDRRVVERKRQEHPHRGNFSGVLRFERVG